VVGQGTTFSVYLPASAEAAERTKPAALPPGGRERILLVDDEPAVRASLGRLLERQGYAVTQASSPHAALELLAEKAQAFDLSSPI